MAQVAEAPSVVEAVKQTGYWRLILHPTHFDKDRIPRLSDAEDLVRRAVVRLRGWDFPHIDPHHGVTKCRDWVESSCNWQEKVEYWRFHRSGQFVYLLAMEEDYWVDADRVVTYRDDALVSAAVPYGGGLLDIVCALYRITELFVFGSALAPHPAFEDGCVVEVQLHGTKGRTLMDWERRAKRVLDGCACVSDSVEICDAYPSLDMRTRPAVLALDMTERVLEQFQWAGSRSLLASSQARLLERRL